MTDAAEPESTAWRPTAWQPLTPRGVAAFARAPLMRLLLVQFIFALLAAIAVVWFLRTAWFPTVREAIENLPAQGEMKSGKLEWTADSPHPTRSQVRASNQVSPNRLPASLVISDRSKRKGAASRDRSVP